MNKKLSILLKAAMVSVIFLSCSGGESDDVSENTNINIGNSGNNLILVSSKTQASIDTTFEFYFQNSINEQITNVNWDFGDGSTYYGDGSLSKIYHNYKTAGSFTVKATLVLAGGTNIVKTVNVTVTNTNLLKIKKITVTSIPQKTTNLNWVMVTGTTGNWVNFTGAWDESKSYMTTNVNKYADMYLELYKNSSTPDPNNPHQFLPSNTSFMLSTGIVTNQQANVVFDLSSYNITLGYEALNGFNIYFKDNDAVNSLVEDGSPDELMATFSISASEFIGSSRTFTQGNLSFKIDFEKL